VLLVLRWPTLARHTSENPLEHIYDTVGKMLNMPTRKDAVTTEKAPAGFKKIRLLVESVSEDGSMRTRRVTAALPKGSGEADGISHKFEKEAVAALHAIVWASGPDADAVEVTGSDEMEALREEIEELRDVMEDMRYENEQLKKDSAVHVEMLEEENERLRDMVEEMEFDQKELQKQSMQMVEGQEDEIETLKDENESLKFDAKRQLEAAQAYVLELEAELSALKGGGGGGEGGGGGDGGGVAAGGEAAEASTDDASAPAETAPE
jgi:hypothetical protein